MQQTTLCYIENDRAQYLMLHRVKKKNDVNHDTWIGLGGKLEAGETPLACALREVQEESGLTLRNAAYRGVVTFLSDIYPDECMHLFTATQFSGALIACNEGNLEWVNKSQISHLPIWEGDKIFLQLLADDHPFFHLELVYQGDTLVSHRLQEG